MNRSSFAVALAICSLAATIVLPGSLRAQDPAAPSEANADWKPAKGRLMTRWAEQVSPANALPDYPRPHLVRKAWFNLNGLWDYRIENPKEEPETPRAGKILVPYPLESALSGVAGKLLPDETLVYERAFTVPADFYDAAGGAANGGRLRIHFGAVDWECTVFLDDAKLGTHRGGYDPFWFDVPLDSLAKDESHRLRVVVTDPSDTGYQPVGKQSLNPHGIWYTAVSGIWQTVWIEPLSRTAIDSVDVVVTDVDAGTVELTPNVSGAKEGDVVQVTVSHRALFDDVVKELSPIRASAKAGETIRLTIDDPRAWSPDEPWLYFADVEIVAGNDRGERKTTLDRATTYFGLRDVKVAKADDGHQRIFLNGEPLFQYGLLDQGWWPDGLYTAPTDEALRYDIEMTKALGFNMARKHVKVEPARWYSWCDRLGLLVWQDMPSGEKKIAPGQPDIVRSEESEATYRQEWSRIVEALDHSPSIVVWVPFNEGWGQFKTNEILAWSKTLDPTRPIDGPSGWQDRGEGDLLDMHNYPGPGMPSPEPGRVSVLGEFGGLGLAIDDHLWVEKNNWGYRSFETREELEANYRRLVNDLRPLIGRGLAAAVYTQTTDVEIEVNGLMTYDRAIVKLPESIRAAHAKLYLPPPTIEPVLATSRDEPHEWRYTTDDVADDWFAPAYDAASWKRGPAGFGTKITPNSVVRTEWNSPTIRIRRTFELDELPEGLLAVEMFHDENADVWLNGKKILSVDGYIVGYRTFPTDHEAKDVLKQGENVIAIECRQTGGGQYIDAGLSVVRER